jgi:hypothetical protein
MSFETLGPLLASPTVCLLAKLAHWANYLRSVLTLRPNSDCFAIRYGGFITKNPGHTALFYIYLKSSESKLSVRLTPPHRIASRSGMGGPSQKIQGMLPCFIFTIFPFENEFSRVNGK